MNKRQARAALRKEQDIICVDTDVFAMWCALALDSLYGGIPVKATIYLYKDGKEIQRVPKRKE